MTTEPSKPSFWSLVEKSVINSGLVAVMLVVTLCICILKGTEVPPVLAGMVASVVTFFFARKMVT